MPKRQPCPWRGTVGYYSTEGRPSYCPRPVRWRAKMRSEHPDLGLQKLKHRIWQERCRRLGIGPYQRRAKAQRGG